MEFHPSLTFHLRSCFFWTNNKASSSKVKRSGSVDSLLSVHQMQLGGRNQSEDYTTDSSTLAPFAESPPGEVTQQASKQQASKYSISPGKAHKSGSLGAKSSTYYLASPFDSSQHSFYGRQSAKVGVSSK